MIQEQLAERMGVTRQTVSRWETDEVIPERFETECPGVQYSEKIEADYAVMTITKPFVQAFERIIYSCGWRNESGRIFTIYLAANHWFDREKKAWQRQYL